MGREPTDLDQTWWHRFRALRSATARHSVDIVFGVTIATVFVHLVGFSRGTYFFGDDWKLLFQGGSVAGLLEPYNGHLSVLILGAYRVLIELFGFTYWPFQLLGLACLMSIPVAYFATTRRILGAPLAAIAALSLLAFAEMALIPAGLNHYVALTAAILGAAALKGGRRADGWVAAALALALSAAGGGVAVAAAFVVHSSCTRAPLRRWIAVLGPCALWGAWWLVKARDGGAEVNAPGEPSFVESLAYARDVAWAPFDHLGLGLPALSAVLVATFIGYGTWSLRRGLATAASFLAWTTAIGVWGIGLAMARGPTTLFGGPAGVTFRYQLLALGFALLAVVPHDPIRWPTRVPLATNPRWLTAAAVVILGVTGAVGMAIRDDVEDRAEVIESYTRLTKGGMVVLDLGPTVVPDDVAMAGNMFWLRAEEVRVVLARHDNPYRTTPAAADQQLIDVGTGVVQEPRARERRCRPLTEPIAWRTDLFGEGRLWSDQETWTVYVRRFGPQWIELAEATANRTLALSLPPFRAEEPWEVRADGACRVRPPPPG